LVYFLANCSEKAYGKHQFFLKFAEFALRRVFLFVAYRFPCDKENCLNSSKWLKIEPDRSL